MNMEFLLSKHPHHQQVRFNTELQEQWLPLFRSPLNEGHLLTIFQLPQDHFSSLTCSVPASTSSTPTPHGPTVIKTHHWLEIFQQMTCSVPDKTFNGLSLNSILCIFSGFYLSTVKVLPKILSSALLPFSPLSSVSLAVSSIPTASPLTAMGTSQVILSEMDIPPRSESVFLFIWSFLMSPSVTIQHFPSRQPTQMLGILKTSSYSFTKKRYCVPSVF